MKDHEAQVDPGALAAERRKLAIERLIPLLQAAEGDPKAEMMLRLAELYASQGRAQYLAEMEACRDAPSCDNSASRAWQERSVALYEAILAGYPRFGRADQATFFLGATLADLGRADDAAEAYRSLVRLYPGSSYLPDALLMLGEYYFDVQNDAFKALAAYGRAAAIQDFPKHNYALYRLAWCQYNVGEIDTAIQSLKTVIDLERQSEPVEGQITVGEQALGDIVQFYADADRLHEALPYLDSLGRADLIPGLLKRLSAVLESQGKMAQAITVLQRLLLERPLHEGNPALWVQIAKDADAMADRDQTLSALSKAAALVSPGSRWSEANTSGAPGAREEVALAHREIASRWHVLARQHDRSRAADTLAIYAHTDALYRAHLEAFPESKDRAEILYNDGELLYRLERYDEAWQRYTASVDLEPGGERARFCAKAAIHAAEAQIRAEGGSLLPPNITPDKDTPPMPLTPWEQRYVDSCARYLALFPDGEVTEALYRSAYLLYSRFHFDEASVLFRRVVALGPKTPQARLAADLILDALAIREDWDALAETAAAFAEEKSLGDSLFRADIQKIHINAEFKRIEARYAKDRDALAAGRAFLAFSERFPAADTAALALNNAAAHLTAASALSEAMVARERLIARGESPYLRDQIALLAFDRERTADYEGAAVLYEQLWGKPPRDERSITALYSAAVLRDALGQHALASEDTRLLHEAAPADRRSTALALRLIRSSLAAGDHRDVISRCSAFDKDPPEAATAAERYWVRLQLGLALEASSEPARAAAVHAETLARFRAERSPADAVEHASSAWLASLAPQIASYESLSIRGPTPPVPAARESAILQAALAKKLRALLAIEESLNGIVALGAAQPGLRATLAAGALYEELGRTLRESDRPRSLTPDQLDDYERELENRIYAQEQKAHDAYRLVLEQSVALALPGALAREAAARAQRLRPEDEAGLLPEERLFEAPLLVSSHRPRGGFEESL